jgi:hypothetical protein
MTPDCAQNGTSLSQTRHRGSKSPMICLNTRGGRRLSNDPAGQWGMAIVLRLNVDP